jgi:hypothetical protein
MKPQDADQNVPPPFLYFDNLPAWRRQAPHATVAAGPHAPTILHRPAHKQRPTMRSVPTFALFVVLFLIGLGAAWACHQLRQLGAANTPQHRLDLLAHAPNSKVNTIRQVPAHAAKLASANAQTHHPVDPPSTLGSPGVEPCKLAPQVLSADGKAPSYCIYDVHPGVSPMLHNWTTFTFASLLALTLAPSSPAVAGDGDPQVLKEFMEKKLNNLEKSLLEALDAQKSAVMKNADANTLELKTLFSELKTAIGNLALDVKNIQTGSDKRTLDDIRVQLTRIEEALKRTASPSQISMSPPPPTGQLELTNSYSQEVLFIINGRTNYRVPPMTSLRVTAQPIGPFRYEVFVSPFGVIREEQRTLEAGKTFTLTVRP